MIRRILEKRLRSEAKLPVAEDLGGENADATHSSEEVPVSDVSEDVESMDSPGRVTGSGDGAEKEPQVILSN